MTVLKLQIIDRVLGVLPVRLDRDSKTLIRFEEDLLVGDGGLVECARYGGNGSALLGGALWTVLRVSQSVHWRGNHCSTWSIIEACSGNCQTPYPHYHAGLRGQAPRAGIEPATPV